MYANPNPRRAQLGAPAPVLALDPIPAGLHYRIVRNGREHGEVPPGDAGTWFTLGIMRELALADAPLLAPEARRIVTANQGNPLAALRRFLADRVRFTRDPSGVELMKSPSYQLGAIRTGGTVSGDCDDIAILGASLGLAAGFPARFKVLRFEPGGPFEHVYTELRGPSGWFELDTSRELQRVPADVRPAELQTFDVGAPDDVLQRVRLR